MWHKKLSRKLKAKGREGASFIDLYWRVLVWPVCLSYSAYEERDNVSETSHEICERNCGATSGHILWPCLYHACNLCISVPSVKEKLWPCPSVSFLFYFCIFKQANACVWLKTSRRFERRGGRVRWALADGIEISRINAHRRRSNDGELGAGNGRRKTQDIKARFAEQG